MPVRSNLTWPAWPRLVLTNKRGEVFHDTTYRRLDLFDRLMMDWPKATRTIYLSVSTKAKNWERWDEANLKAIEAHIRHDLNFDWCSVALRRMTVSRRPFPCTSPFQWQLRIRNRFAS